MLPCSTARSCDSLRAAAWRSACDFCWLEVAGSSPLDERAGRWRHKPVWGLLAWSAASGVRFSAGSVAVTDAPRGSSASPARDEYRLRCRDSSSPGASHEVCSPSAHAAGAALNKRRHLLFHPATALARPCGFSGAASQRCEEPGHSSNRSCVLRDVPGPLLAFARPGRRRFTRMRIRQRSWGFSLFAAFPSCGSCGISARSTHLPFRYRRTGVLAGGSADVSWFTFT